MRFFLRVMAVATFGLVGLAAAALATGLPGDRMISSDRAASDLSGFGDALVWSHRTGSKRHQLRVYRGGQVQRVKTPSSREEMDADVGPGSDGQPALVYRSCRPKCRIYTYSIAAKRERRLPISTPRGCDAQWPAISGRSVVYSLRGERCGGRREGVWVLSGRRVRQVVPSDAGQMDLKDNQVVFTHFGDVVNRVRSTLLTPGSPIVSLFADGERCCGYNVIISSPTFDGSAVYWGDWNHSSRRSDFHRLYRATGAGAACEASDVQFPSATRAGNSDLPWIDYTVTGGRIFYITPKGIFERLSTAFSTQFSKYPASSPTAPFCGP